MLPHTTNAYSANATSSSLKCYSKLNSFVKVWTIRQQGEQKNKKNSRVNREIGPLKRILDLLYLRIKCSAHTGWQQYSGQTVWSALQRWPKRPTNTFQISLLRTGSVQLFGYWISGPFGHISRCLPRGKDDRSWLDSTSSTEHTNLLSLDWVSIQAMDKHHTDSVSLYEHVQSRETLCDNHPT